jgi:hypothetical protein
MAKAKSPSKKTTTKRKAKEPIVEVEHIEPAEDVTFEAPEMPAEPAPNVIWRGDKEPSEKPQIGMDTFNLPNAEIQREGFYLEPWQARRLVIGIPGYKHLKPKG